MMPGGPQNDGDDDDDDKEGETWFAGGERSGISVQNPNAGPSGRNLVRDILRQAAEGGMAAPPPESHRAPGLFSGGGYTLGSDEVESTFVPDPNAVDGEDEDEIAVRHLHLWSDGFSIEDGPLMGYDEPGNRELLMSIRQGTAPLSLLNIRQGQRVNLNVVQNITQAYVPPKRGHFSGSGQRLGAPTPPVSSGATSSMPGSFPTSSTSGASSITSVERPNINTHFEVDQTQPTTSVQIRLADGTRMPCRMNLTHTVGDLRSFINASRPENLTRPYTIGTTFPNRTLEDDTQTIQAAGLVNSVIVQRWV